MKISIPGGMGFIGHHLALRLRKQHELLLVDSLTVNNKYVLSGDHEQSIIAERMRLLSGVPLAIADARDYHVLSGLIGDFKPDAIIHLAAVAHLDRANKDPHSTFDHSLRTLENSLDIARSLGCHFVYFSSSTVYGDFKKDSIDETEPCDPRGIYGALKQCGEIMVRAYGALYDMPYTIVRPCALYGPRCVSGRVIQRFIEAAERGETLQVTPGRVDFTYIDDLVQGVERILTTPAARGEVFHLTAGEARPLDHLTTLLSEYFHPVKIIRQARDMERPDRGTMSVDKARRLLGYEPKFTLERGVASYVAWYRAFWKRKEAA